MKNDKTLNILAVKHHSCTCYVYLLQAFLEAVVICLEVGLLETTMDDVYAV